MRRALHGARLPPVDFCHYVYTARAHPRAPCPRISSQAVNVPCPWGGRPRLRRSLLGEQRASPLEEASRRLRAESGLLKCVLRRCKHADNSHPKNHHPIEASLAGGTSTQPSLATAAGWMAVLDCSGQETWSEGPPRSPPAAAGRCGQRFPSSVKLPAHPSFVAGSSYGGLDAPFVLMNRPRLLFPRHPAKRQRFPESRSAFHRSESCMTEITLPRAQPTHS